MDSSSAQLLVTANQMESYTSSNALSACLSNRRHGRQNRIFCVILLCSSSSSSSLHSLAFSPFSRTPSSTHNLAFRHFPETCLYMSTKERVITPTQTGNASRRPTGTSSRNVRRTYKDIKQDREKSTTTSSSPSSSSSSSSPKSSSANKNESPVSPKTISNTSTSSSATSATSAVVTTGLQNSTTTPFNPSSTRRTPPNKSTTRRLDLSPEEQQRSIERMNKAKRLLADVLSEPNIDEDSAFLFASDEVVEVDVVTPVPDNFWYNGNLLEGGGAAAPYVTRWANGVKVAEPLRKYDPIATEKRLFAQPAKWLIRNVQIGFPLAIWAVGVVYDIFTRQEEINRRNRARQLLQTISSLGPAIIKGGQALASRSDLLPSEYLDELQKLQDDVPRFDNARAFATVEKELDIKFDDVFELVNNDPIAAASIGQVYKARLRSNNDLVALKIQRPNCEEVIALDLYVLRWWSGIGTRIMRLLKRDIDLQSIIDDFGVLIYRELDYVAEAANAQRFNELYSGIVKDVFVPKVYSDLTTNKVLTMEWVDGVRLTDTETLEMLGLDRRKLVDTLVQCSMKQILENGFFHCDPHAGNLLACKDGRLCYLDFGMMSYASATQRNGFLLAVVHIVNRDWDELVRLYQRLGFIPEGTDLRPIAVALENTLPDALNAEVSELNFKNVVGKLGDIFYKYPFSLPPFYISIIRCLGVLEGLAIQVDPQARIISKAYPYIASRVLTDPQNELQEALRRLALTSDGSIRWSRLESLLDEAKESQGYDASAALNQLTNYLISDDGERVLNEIEDKLVEGTDSLGTETMNYLVEAAKSLAINDEVAAVNAFRTLTHILDSSDGGDRGKKLRESLATALPEPSPTMKQFWRIASLLGARGSDTDPAKLIPVVRKLGQEPKIQKASREVIAKLGERMLNRSLRVVFGLPPETS